MGAGPVPCEVQATCARVAARLFGSSDPAWTDVRNAQEAFSQADMSGEYVFPEGICYETRGERVKKAAIEGDVQAQHSLGLLYFGGYGGLEQSDELSAMWHAAAAAGGNWDAVAVLGGCLRKGSGVAKDVSLGLRFISLASAVGNPSGLNKAGGLLEQQGDLADALELYQKAAQQNNALALFSVGWAMLEDDWKSATRAAGIARDERAAEELWRRAAALAPADASEEAAYHLAMRLRQRAKGRKEDAKGRKEDAKRCKEEAQALMRLSQLLGFRP